MIDSSGEASLEQVFDERDPSGVVEMHRVIAMRLLREGSKVQAFQELVRACRVVPMNPRLASALVYLSLHARTFGPALTLLSQGIDETDGGERIKVMRLLARLARHANDLERSRETLVMILAELPADRRARAVLNALLEREERWEELDASLEKETKEALRRGALLRATRSALRRGRMWDTRLDEHARAALRYMQAAQYAEQAGDLPRSFWIRLLWLRSLHRSEAPTRSLDDAVRVVMTTAEKTGQLSHARSIISELGLAMPSKTPALGATSVARAITASGSGSGLKAVSRTPAPAPERVPERRRSTQLELMAVAEAAEKAGQRTEAAAVLSAAVREGDDPAAARRLESMYVQRAAWRDLATLYRDLSARAAEPAERAAWAEKLAELLESELADPGGAAKAWGEVASLTGDSRAVSEQVRLLAQKKDGTGVRAALTAGIEQASTAEERAQALVWRGEDAVARKDLAAAKADFEAALALNASEAGAAAGLAELAVGTKELAPLRAFEKVLAKRPKFSKGRGDLYRRLARLADGEGPMHQQLSRSAWGEVLAELPEDEEATARVLALTRSSADGTALESQLRGLLQREPRGVRSRGARMELVALLEASGRGADALAALKDAVSNEPGHQEAWVAYADRLERLANGEANKLEEVAWALEHAATATAEPLARAALWRRLAKVFEAGLKDPVRAGPVALRADRILGAQAASQPSPSVQPALETPPESVLPPDSPLLPGGPLVIPARRAPMSRPKSPPPPARDEDFEAIAAALESRLEPENTSGAYKRIPERVARTLERSTIEIPVVAVPSAPVSHAQAPEGDDDSETRELSIDEADLAAVQQQDEGDVEEIFSGDFEVPASAPNLPPVTSVPARLGYESQDHTPVELGDPGVQVAPSSYGASPAKLLSAEREALFERVRNDPLDADGYRMLAEHFDTANDATRSSLMLELARALEGDPHAAPRTPRLILNEADRGGLRHPALRGESGELLSLVGFAVIALNPAKGRDGGSQDEFHLEAGKGAKAAADALLAGVRILGLRAPDVFLSEDAGPPFSLVYAGTARVLVGRQAVRRELNDAELRFYAGRALFTQLPDLMALRNVSREQVLRGLSVVDEVAGGRTDSVEARVVRDMIPGRSWERIKPLLKTVLPRIDVGRLADGARHSANRAGLVVCGGVAPALAALRAKKALPAEMIELVRFAASERYLQLRGRVLLPKR